MRGDGRAAAVGVVSTGAALGLAELLAGLLPGVPSLVASAGSAVIPFTPGWLERWAIATFGTADKLVLEVGVVIVVLAVGAWAGVRSRTDRRAGYATVAVLAVIGGAVMLSDALASWPLTIATVVAVAVAGAAALRWGLDRDPSRSPTVVSAPPDRDATPGGLRTLDRRRFLATVGALGAAAIVTGAAGRALLRRGEAVDPVALSLPDPVSAAPPVRPANALRIDGLAPIVVPNDDFYRIDTALVVPRLDAADWSLRIHGLVDREVTLTYDELSAMPLVEEYVTLSCVSNEVGGDLVGNAAWLGVPLRDLLDLAGVRPEAGQVVGRAVDGWTAGFPTEVLADDRTALVAIGMNGEPLPAAHGFPARLVVAGLYGYVSATKWLSEIELTTWEGFDAYWIPRGWSKTGPIKTQSRIDVPRRGDAVDAGSVTIAGVAWAPTRGVQRVEIAVDDGDWQECDLTEPLSDAAWVQWRRRVDLGPGDHTVRVRATDGRGVTQTERVSRPAPDGATGHDTIRFRTV